MDTAQKAPAFLSGFHVFICNTPHSLFSYSYPLVTCSMYLVLRSNTSYAAVGGWCIMYYIPGRLYQVLQYTSMFCCLHINYVSYIYSEYIRWKLCGSHMFRSDELFAWACGLVAREHPHTLVLKLCQRFVFMVTCNEPTHSTAHITLSVVEQNNEPFRGKLQRC